MTRSDFEIVVQTDDAVYLVDLDKGRLSVTNDAEAVVQEVLRKHCQNGLRRIVYMDSMGEWAEMVHDGKRFVDFAPAHGPEALR
jgi:hypothetical protein